MYLSTPWNAMDRRAGYQRQADEPVVITCECGARVVDRFGELHHVGDCLITGDDDVRTTD
jgi:hypothetical protein